MSNFDYNKQARIDKAIDKTGGVYPGLDNDDYLHCGLPGVGYIACRWSRVVSTVLVCTRAEYEARKAERQNKPSWKDAPEWANWLAQDGDDSAMWCWYREKPEAESLEFSDGTISAFASSRGEVIGNWQYTLEQRPSHVVESTEKVFGPVEPLESPLKTELKTSIDYLHDCIAVQSDRGKEYDQQGTGERSFAAAAQAFNAATGKNLTGSDVCLVLEMVKLVRQYSSPNRLHADSVLDKVSYSSLWAEELTRELSDPEGGV